MGGIERALSILANEWVKLGYQVVYVSCLKSDPFYELDSNIRVIEPTIIRSSSIWNKLLFYPQLIIFIRRTVKKVNPDKVLVFGDWFSPLSLLALKGTKYPVFVSDRTIPDYPFKFPIPHLKKWLYPSAAGFIAQTNRSKKFKENIFGNRIPIAVIPNALAGFDCQNFSNTPKRNMILYVGRFEWEKDPEILIHTFSEMCSNLEEWTLEMAGDGPLLEKMKGLADKLQISDKITFHGKVKNVGWLYSEASIFVLPSIIEGFPNALIEAMSFGLPCVCFSDIPYEDIISPENNGIVLFQRDPSVLATALNNLIKNKSHRERIGSAAKAIKIKCSPRKVSEEILSFMDI